MSKTCPVVIIDPGKKVSRECGLPAMASLKMPGWPAPWYYCFGHRDEVEEQLKEKPSAPNPPRR